MNEVDTQHYIKIIVGEKMDKDNLKLWFKSAATSAPNGVITTVQTFKEGVGPKSVQMIHRVEEGQHHYLIPLTRDLVEDEIHPIFETFASMYEEGDFELDGSGWDGCCPTTETETVSIEIEDDGYKALCEKLAKAMHHRWYEDKVEEGWRYGITLNEEERTSPLLRPWDDLPEAYRDVDYTLPETLMNVFEEEGYAIVSKDDLDKLMK